MVLVKVGAAGYIKHTWDLKGLTNIVQIAVTYSSDAIKSLQFTFLQEDGNLHTPDIIGSPHTGGSLNVITFKGGGEYLTAVEGLYSLAVCGPIKMLRIHTNIQVYDAFVAEDDLTNCKKFSFKFGGLNQFAGFHGSRSNYEVCAIGVYYKQLEALPLNFKCSPSTRLFKREV